MQSIYDNSNESLIVKMNQGFKVIRPDHYDHMNTQFAVSKVMSLHDAMDLPFNFYMTSKDHIIRKLNDLCASSHGHDKNTLQGLDVKNAFEDKEFTTQLLANDAMVMSTRRPHFFDEYSVLNDKSVINGVSLKMPWLNDKNAVIGIIGCSIVFNTDSFATLARNLSLITKTFLFNVKMHPKNCISEIYFSRREQEVIDWLLCGKSIRQIGEIMELSSRTVESYYNNIKRKANVNTKSELFEFILSTR